MPFGIMRFNVHFRLWIAATALFALVPAASALDPHKSLTQYTRRVWTQQDGLPQDTIRAIAQTSDGYLWIGTDDGLARFDGYEFTLFNKSNGDLPSNSITALAATPDGSLWIGTSDGLAQYANKRFRTYTRQQGLTDNTIGGAVFRPQRRAVDRGGRRTGALRERQSSRTTNPVRRFR